MSEELFLKEILICKDLYNKNKGCNWGKCEDCGVIPLLHKLHKGILLENINEIVDFKKSLLN